MKIRVGSLVVHNNYRHKVISKIKGVATDKPVMHSGALCTGFVHKPTTYVLDNGAVVRPKNIQNVIEY